MKWILILLLLSNGLLLGSFFFLNQESTKTEVLAAPQLNNLSLTSEQALKLSNDSVGSAVLDISDVARCIEISSFADDSELATIRARLKALEIEPQFVQREIRTRADYQVVLGPFVTNEAARSNLTQTTVLNVEGYVIAGGEMKNAISLGVFSSRANANRFISSLPELPFEPSIFEKPYFQTTSFLLVNEASSSLLSDESLTAIIPPDRKSVV